MLIPELQKELAEIYKANEPLLSHPNQFVREAAFAICDMVKAALEGKSFATPEAVVAVIQARIQQINAEFEALAAVNPNNAPEAASELSEINREWVMKLVKNQYTKQLSLAGKFSLDLPSERQLVRSVLKTLKNPQVDFLRQMSHASLLIIPIGLGEWSYVSKLTQVQLKTMASQQDPFCEHHWMEALNKTIAFYSPNQTISGNVSHCRFVIADGRPNIKSVAGNFDYAWNRDENMTVIDRMLVFATAMRNVKGIESINTLDYFFMMAAGLIDQSPPDTTTQTLLCGIPKDAHAKTHLVTCGEWEASQNRPRFFMKNYEIPGSNVRIRPCVSGDISQD